MTYILFFFFFIVLVLTILCSGFDRAVDLRFVQEHYWILECHLNSHPRVIGTDQHLRMHFFVVGFTGSGVFLKCSQHRGETD